MYAQNDDRHRKTAVARGGAMINPAQPYDALVIGGGFYGCCLALFLQQQGASVAILEKESELLTRSSYVNQARVHGGYHYPRSFTTALRSFVNFPRFLLDFAGCIDDSFQMIYAIARGSKVNAFQFHNFCKRVGAPISAAPTKIKRLFSPTMIEEVFCVREFAFDAVRLREKLRDRLEHAGVAIHYRSEVERAEGVEGGIRLLLTDGQALTTQHAFNCTYSQINSFLRASRLDMLPMKHEITEVALVQLPDALHGYGVTVMDGPFFSTMPFPARQLYSFTHVRYTPHEEWRDAHEPRNPHAYLATQTMQSHFPFMKRDAQRFLPMLAETQYVDSLYEVKTVLLQNEGDDGRPILLRHDYGIPHLSVIMGGKIDNIYDVLHAMNEFHGHARRVR